MLEASWGSAKGGRVARGGTTAVGLSLRGLGVSWPRHRLTPKQAPLAPSGADTLASAVPQPKPAPISSKIWQLLPQLRCTLPHGQVLIGPVRPLPPLVHLQQLWQG